MDDYTRAMVEQARSQGATQEEIDFIVNTTARASQAAQANDPEGAILAWLAPVLEQSATAGVDITAALAERSIRDGGDVVLLARITTRQLAVLRGVSVTAGGYEQALRVIIEAFINRAR
jgi:hypothetical protein